MYFSQGGIIAEKAVSTSTGDRTTAVSLKAGEEGPLGVESIEGTVICQ